MPKVTIAVSGLKELGASMKALDEDMRKRIVFAMTGGAASLVKKEAIVKAPIAEKAEGDAEPGNLKRNVIAVKVRKTSLSAEHLVTVRAGQKAGWASRYGSMLEHGTVKMGARPWMRPAFDENVRAAIAEMKAIGERRVRAAVRKAAKQAAKR